MFFDENCYSGKPEINGRKLSLGCYMLHFLYNYSRILRKFYEARHELNSEKSRHGNLMLDGIITLKFVLQEMTWGGGGADWIPPNQTSVRVLMMAVMNVGFPGWRVVSWLTERLSAWFMLNELLEILKSCAPVATHHGFECSRIVFSTSRRKFCQLRV
jgi:hypothetical protein